MAEPSRSGCLTSLLMLLAAIFGSFMAAFHSTSVTPLSSSAIVTHAIFAPVGDFTADELQQAAQVIGKRLNGLDLTSATVDVSGDTAIDVGLPQVDDLDDVLKTISARGLLEFVDFSDITDTSEWQGRDILTTGQGNHPISATAENNPATDKPFETILTGDSVQSATATLDQQFNQWQVTVDFSDDAGKILGDYTRSHIGKALAIILDGKVLSVPIIQTELSSTAVITGNFTEQDTKRLAVQLGSGSLPFELQLKSIQSDTGIAVNTAEATTNP